MTDNRTSELCLAIDANVIETIKTRRSAGESLGKLATELGLSWQRLWTLLYQPATAQGPQELAKLRPNMQAGSLIEKYRPTSFQCLFGQEQVVKVLRNFAANPHPAAFIFEGATGTGKTSAALALAAELGCELSAREFGGVHSIASGEQSADAVREAYHQMHNSPWQGSGWKVVIVNEADRMARAAETIWLDVLEAIPPRTVIVFTTNEAARLSQRFLDRCKRLAFESDAGKLARSARQLVAAIWKNETHQAIPPATLSRLVDEATIAGQISFRRLIQLLSVELAAGGDQ